MIAFALIYAVFVFVCLHKYMYEMTKNTRYNQFCRRIINTFKYLELFGLATFVFQVSLSLFSWSFMFDCDYFLFFRQI